MINFNPGASFNPYAGLSPAAERSSATGADSFRGPGSTVREEARSPQAPDTNASPERGESLARVEAALQAERQRFRRQQELGELPLQNQRAILSYQSNQSELVREQARSLLAGVDVFA